MPINSTVKNLFSKSRLLETGYPTVTLNESELYSIFLIICNIAKKGFSGMRSSSPASISLYLDSDVLRNPFHAILPPLCYIKESLQ